MHFPSSGEEHHADLNISGTLLHTYLSDVGQQCSEMLVRCHFEGHDRACADLFEETVTDEGQCCAFNLMPEAVMFRNKVTMVQIYVDDVVKWRTDSQNLFLKLFFLKKYP